MADVSVRLARAGDAADVGRVQVTTWQQAYAKVLPAPVLDGLTVDAATAAWRQAIEAAPSPGHRVLVALEQQWVVGFVAVVPVEADRVEIGPLLVEPRWGRRGHGSRLLAAAVDHARTDGATSAVAWVPEADTVTSALFTSAGWAPDGLVRGFDTGAGEVREVSLHVSLLEAPSAG